jgi:glucokinase-like ROK family protein
MGGPKFSELVTPPPSGLRARHSGPARRRRLGDSVLRMIWREKEISRAEIARRAELSRSTVSEIVDALLPTGLIAEVGTGPSGGGRRPIVLQFQDEAFVILGVELGATHVAVALTDLRGKVLAWESRDHPVRTDPEGTRALMVELCDLTLSKWPRGKRGLVGIGVAVPSPVDPSQPERLSGLVLPAWQGNTGFEVLARRYRVPLMMDNDANLGALAEQWWGAGRGIEDFAYIKVGTGIGSGHILGGEIYRGATGVAGEIGHLAIDPQGQPCMCGLRGCLATLIGAPALVARTRALRAEYPETALADVELTITAIEDAALAGDLLAHRVTREAAEYLGIALADLLNLLNPAKVILGGGLSRLGELLLEPLREAVGRHTLLSSLAASAIQVSELGPRAVSIGAATLVLRSALADSRRFPAAGQRVGPR